MGKEVVEGKKNNNNGFKKQYNNYNPYNKLELNKFHQLSSGEPKTNYSQKIHKKKRDMERMIEYRKKQGLQIEQTKMDQLDQINGELNGRKKDFQKEKRKEFFIQSKYKQIMNIEKRKIAKKLREIKESSPVDRDLLAEWYRKLNYVKHFPTTLKYISLFPTSPMNQKAKEFQNKIMNDIQLEQSKKLKKLNQFETQYKVKEEKKTKKTKKDDFFIQDIEQEPSDEEVEEVEQQQAEQQSEEQQVQEE